MIAALVLAAGVVVRTEILPPEAIEPDPARRRPVRVVCAVGKPTRIVFPEPLVGFKASGETKATLGLRPVANAPKAVFVVTPTAHPARGAFEFKGRTIAVTVVLETAEKGEAQEIRLQTKDQVPPSPPPVPSPKAVPASPKAASPSPSPRITPRPTPSPTVTPTPTPTPSPSAAPTAAPLSPGNGISATAPPEAAVDFRELELAKRIAIGRREGLPGQRVVELEDALQGERHVWLRFRVLGGSALKVAKVEWEHGVVANTREVPRGKDLHLVVQLPRAQVTKRTRVKVRLSDGADYTFALSSPFFSTFLRSLFG